MAYTSVSISTAQSLGVPSIIILTDTSSGSDVLVTARKVYLRTSTTTWLYETQQISSTILGIDWSIANASINLDVLTEASTLEITVDWVNSLGVALYSYTTVAIFDIQNYIFQLGILSNQTSAPGVLQDTEYYNNLIKYIVNLDNAEVAAEIGGDIYSSQQALNRNQVMIDNENFYF